MRTLVRFLLWTIVIVGVIVGAARATFLRWVTLPENDPVFETSIIPSLRGGDTILLTRLTRPVLGDLVLCPEPDYPSRYVIGRIVGEVGDTVRIVNGVPEVNGRRFHIEGACDERQVRYPNPDNDTEEVVQSCVLESIANHLHQTGTAVGPLFPTDVEHTVESGKVFLLSDNRQHPYDSRDFGPVDIETCKETVVGRLVSKDGWLDSENRLDYIQ